MGRPPLGIIATKVQLRADQLARVDNLAGGDKHRSKWIRQAIDEKLAREEPPKAD